MTDTKARKPISSQQVTLDTTGGEWEIGSLISVLKDATLNLYGTGFETTLTDIGGGVFRDVH